MEFCHSTCSVPDSMFPVISSYTTFYPNNVTLPGLPYVNINGTQYPSIGYQGGDMINGKCLYYPWQVMTGGQTSWGNSILSGVTHGVILSYNCTITNGFNISSNWQYFDLATLNSNAVGYVGAVVAPVLVFLVPTALNQNPVFVRYNSSAPVNAASSYKVFIPPPRNGGLGANYGWCTGFTAGNFAYFIPSFDGTTIHGNLVRFNMLKNFTALAYWQNFDLTLVNTNAKGFQSGVFDGNKYIYYVPYVYNYIVIYDTSGQFNLTSSYTTFDPTKLGQSGIYPSYTGVGLPSNLFGFTGAVAVFEVTNSTQYLYLTPWADATTGSGKTLHSTVTRVQIGSKSGGTWSPVNISSPSTTWELFDLNYLTQNCSTGSMWKCVGWPCPATYASGAWTNQSMLAGYQLNFINTAKNNVKVGFYADVASFYVQHVTNLSLSDPSAWHVTPTPNSTIFHTGQMGGAYDITNSIIYPAMTQAPLFQISGLH